MTGRSQWLPRSSFAVLLLLAVPAWTQTNLRSWSADGQTWLVWEDDLGLAANPLGVETYDVYRAPTAIDDVGNAVLAGRVFVQDWAANRLRLAAGPTATFSIPDGLGGTYTLAANEALFVYTPHTGAAEYFAVVASTASSPQPGLGAKVGPIPPSTSPVRPHLQATGIDAGHPYSLYGIWIDGDADHTSGSPAFPIMGSASCNGISQLFCVFEPKAGVPGGLVPATLFLHGSGGSYWKFRPSNSATALIDLNVEDGLYVTLDDSINAYAEPTPGASQVTTVPNRWFGATETFDRFRDASTPTPDGTLVVDYSLRWIDFVLDWLVQARSVDEHRISMSGQSNGARGVLNYARSRPDRVSAGICFVPPFQEDNESPAQTGTMAQNLATNLPGGPGFFTYADPRTTVLATDLPFLRMIWGTNDQQVSWAAVPAGIMDLDAQQRGSHLYWDQRGHTANGGPWLGAYFVGSPRHDPRSLTGYRSDQSFPAFYSADHDPGTPGPQPLPEDPPGDAYGTWGGWIDWDPATIVDTPRRWSCELALVSGSAFPPDDAPSPTATVSLVVRRPQSLRLAPTQPFRWTLTHVASGTLLQAGSGRADATGRPHVPDLLVTAARVRVELVPLATIRETNGVLSGTVQR